jgi:hypothetical protein
MRFIARLRTRLPERDRVLTILRRNELRNTEPSNLSSPSTPACPRLERIHHIGA